MNEDASVFSNLRVLTEKNLLNLKDEFKRFCCSLVDPNLVNDIQRVSGLLSDCSFTRRSFVNKYTKKL